MEQIEKNTVKAENQLNGNEHITYINAEGKGIRILFVGNSITRHGVKPEIGWFHDWGMAASAKEKDYVHLVVSKVQQEDPDAAFCICQGSEWELNWEHGESVFSKYQKAQDFAADVIIMRVIENCPRQNYECEHFGSEYQKFIAFLDLHGTAKKITMTSFWKSHADDAIKAVACKYHYSIVELGDLGEDDTMKATGLFEHRGGAMHPGDNGMRVIAERVCKAMCKS